MDNTPDSPAKTPEGYTTQGGNFWTLITPEIWKVLHAVLHPGLFDFDAVESAVTAIYNKMQDARVSPDVSSLLQDLYDVVDVAVATDTPSVREPTARYDLSNIDFSRLRAEFEKSPFKNVVAMNLMEKIEERLAAMVARNPTRVDLYERYQEIVQEYNKDKDAAEIQKVMDDLFAFNDDCSEEEKRYLREGLDSETELAVFDLLQKDSLTKGDREAIKKVAKDLLGKLADQRFALERLRSMATVQAQMKAEIIKHLYAHLPASAYDPDEINIKAGAVFAHIYSAGLGGGAPVLTTESTNSTTCYLGVSPSRSQIPSITLLLPDSD